MGATACTGDRRREVMEGLMIRSSALALIPLVFVTGCATRVRSNGDATAAPVAAFAGTAVEEIAFAAVPVAETSALPPAAADVVSVAYREPGEEESATVQSAAPPVLASPADPLQNSRSGAAGEGIRLEELESLAFSNNPAIGEQQSRVAALRGQWVQAGLPPNPTAQYAADEIGVDDAAGLHSLSLGQTIVTADKLALRQSVVAAEIRRAEANLAADRMRVRTDVRRAFTAALVAQRRLELSERLQEIANESMGSVSQMLAAAEVSRVALLQAQTEAQQSEMAVETAAASLAGARRQLASVVGVPALSPAPLVGDLSSELEEISYDAALAQLIAASPELADRAAAVERARRSLRLACAQITPNLDLQAGAGYDAGSDDTYGRLQVTIPIPVVDRNQGNIRRFRSEISAAALALQRTELDLGNRLAETLQQYEIARLRTIRLRQQILPRAEEALELSRTAFEVGETSYLELLTAQRTLFQAQLETLAAVEQARQAASVIDGFLLQGSLASNNFQPAID